MVPPAGFAALVRFLLARLWGGKWLAFIAVIAVTVTVFAVSGLPSAEIWTATGTIHIGTVPRFVRIEDKSDDLMESIEDVHATLNRLGEPHFRNAVEAIVESKLAASSRASLLSTLRGTAVSDRDLRIDVSGTSSAAARIGLEAAISRIQAVHRDMTRERLELIDAVLTAADERLTAVNFVSMRSRKSFRRAYGGSGSPAVVIAPSDGEAAALANLMIAKKAIEPTRLMYGTQVSLSGPRSSWQLRTVLLVGLGALLAAMVLTLAATVRN